MMCNNQKGFPTVFALATLTLLSCCFSPVSSYFALPRVSRTSDAIIIDYEGVGYAPFSLGRGYSQFVDPGFVPLPALNPYGMFFGGLSHFGRQTPPAPAPAATCGWGPPPPTRSGISERVEGFGSAAVTKSRTWPFLVVLKRRIWGEPVNVFFCSGTLISNTRVLLAAQCLAQMSNYDISKVLVFVGLSSITVTSSYVQMTRRISRVVIHSGYNAATYANDIAIITLDRPVVFSRTVAPACLPPASTDPDQYVYRDAVVMGWGPAAAGAPSTASKQGKVWILPNDDCRSQDGYGIFVTANNLCISGTDTNVYTCPADVGGPVVLNTAPPTPGTPPVWTVVGINSFTPADACATSTFKNGLKIRVSAFAAWIATYMV